MIQYIIGIDPGTHTGVAVIRGDGSIASVRTMDFWQTYSFVTASDDYTPGNTLLVIEAGGMNKPTFEKKDADPDSVKVMNKVSRNTGSANREADLLAAGFERQGYRVIRVRPVKKKWTPEECQAITGYTGRTNAHVRDGLRLAWEHRHLRRLKEK